MNLHRAALRRLVLVVGVWAIGPFDASAQEMDNQVFHWSQLDVDAVRFDGASAGRWDAAGWIGTDFDRVWWSSEGSANSNAVGSAEVMALYGRYVRRFWDLVIGYRQDIEPTPQGYLAFGIAGLAPYWFEVEALGFVSHRGEPSLRLAAESDLLLTQRTILTLMAETNWLLTDDERLGLDAGIADLEARVRVRFEIRRKFAPYVDVMWIREKEAVPGGATTVLESGARLGAGLRLIY